MSATDRVRGMANRAVSALGYRFHIAAANRWREDYNPLRGLSIRRVVSLLEEGERGAYADLQWTYRFIEMQDATLGALIERRTSAIQQLDWDIRTRDDLPAGKKQVAERQRKALRATYERIGNLGDALEFLAMASFRGFSHLEKVTDGRDIIALEPVEQWFWVRRGLYGGWEYNEGARFGARTGLPVAEGRFVIREVARPINRVALVAFVRKGLSQKDWDGYVESYGIPAVFVIMPESVPKGQEETYLAMAERVTSDARGALPGGSKVEKVDGGDRGTNPFKEHLEYQDQQLVLRGTGGKLTMLAESGSGTLAGGAHTDTFEGIARAEAGEISECMRRQIDAEVLRRETPGEQAWAYFELAANEETDTTQVVRDVALLSRAGYKVEEEWLEEKTGYQVRAGGTPAASVPSDQLAVSSDPVRNRETAEAEVPSEQLAVSSAGDENAGDDAGDDAGDEAGDDSGDEDAAGRRGDGLPRAGAATDEELAREMREAHARDMRPLAERLEEIMAMEDDEARRAALASLSEDMPDYVASPAMEEALGVVMARAFAGEVSGEQSAVSREDEES